MLLVSNVLRKEMYQMVHIFSGAQDTPDYLTGLAFAQLKVSHALSISCKSDQASIPFSLLRLRPIVQKALSLDRLGPGKDFRDLQFKQRNEPPTETPAPAS
jgi:hypothetical protein